MQNVYSHVGSVLKLRPTITEKHNLYRKLQRSFDFT